LDEADDVAVGVFDGGDQGAAADVLDGFVLLGAGGEKLMEAGVDVLDLPVADGAGEAAVWPLGSRPRRWSPMLTWA
jgi:hypothetical protein